MIGAGVGEVTGRNSRLSEYCKAYEVQRTSNLYQEVQEEIIDGNKRGRQGD